MQNAVVMGRPGGPCTLTLPGPSCVVVHSKRLTGRLSLEAGVGALLRTVCTVQRESAGEDSSKVPPSTAICAVAWFEAVDTVDTGNLSRI